MNYTYTVPEGIRYLRADKALALAFPDHSRTALQRAFDSGLVTLRGVAIKRDQSVTALDTLEFAMPDLKAAELRAVDIPLEVIFEDKHMLAVNKAAGMVVHPGHGNYSGTLVNGLIHHIENLPTNSNERPGLVHRIDKDTSGLLVVAKTEKAMTHLSKQFFDKTTERLYYALVWGNIEEEEGTIEGHIGRSLKNRLQMAVFPEGDFGKPAVSHFKVLERFSYVTLVACRLETGRTHQIRVHCKEFGFSIFGDELYGGGIKKSKELKIVNVEKGSD